MARILQLEEGANYISLSTEKICMTFSQHEGEGKILISAKKRQKRDGGLKQMAGVTIESKRWIQKVMNVVQVICTKFMNNSTLVHASNMLRKERLHAFLSIFSSGYRHKDSISE